MAANPNSLDQRHSETRDPLDQERARLDGEAWLTKLARRGERIIGDERNVLLAFQHAPDLLELVRFDEFALLVRFNRAPPWRAQAKAGDPWTDDDDTGALGWLQTQGLDVRQRHVVADTVALLAKQVGFHPVRDYLESLKWDLEPRLNIWLIDYLNAQANDVLYLAAVGRKWLISAVARVYDPGCQVDHVLVFEGPQGCGKSSAARALAVRPGWFSDSLPDLHSKDSSIQLSGRWIIELAELAAMRRGEIEGVKAFLTRPVDVFRPPYGRRTTSVPRQSVFIATTNEQLYLRDSTGNRRFWPVKCSRIDLDALRRDRDQLWAEAVALYRAGEPWHLTEEEAVAASDEQAARMLVTELETSVAQYLERIQAAGKREIDSRTVLLEALNLDPSSGDFMERAGRLGPAVASAMQSAGWAKVRVTGRGRDRRNLWQKPL